MTIDNKLTVMILLWVLDKIIMILLFKFVKKGERKHGVKNGKNG